MLALLDTDPLCHEINEHLIHSSPHVGKRVFDLSTLEAERWSNESPVFGTLGWLDMLFNADVEDGWRII